MFTGKPIPPMNSDFSDLEWAEGRVCWGRQSALLFGADRRSPVFSRPVVTIRRDGCRVIVLPCTKANRASNPAFREIVSPRDVMWLDQAKRPRTFSFRRYETILFESLLEVMGVINHAARINLLKWVKEQY